MWFDTDNVHFPLEFLGIFWGMQPNVCHKESLSQAFQLKIPRVIFNAARGKSTNWLVLAAPMQKIAGNKICLDKSVIMFQHVVMQACPVLRSFVSCGVSGGHCSRLLSKKKDNLHHAFWDQLELMLSQPLHHSVQFLQKHCYEEAWFCANCVHSGD